MVAGRLAKFVNTWKVLTQDSWVLQTVKGFQIPFVGQPVQHQRPAIPCFPLEQLVQIQEEISSLREKGAISVVADPSHSQKQTEFFSNLFLVLKKNGSMRPVINLKALNQWVETPHFKMEGLPTLQDLLRQGDWLVKVDLKDAYFTVPVHPDHHPYLRFVIEGVTYQFTCLPFGLACAPWVFTKLMKTVVTLLRSWGFRMIIYIDDILVMAESATLVRQHLEVLVHLLQCLGFLINFEKSVMSPTQELEFLGMVVNTDTLTVSLPADKIRQIRSEGNQNFQYDLPFSSSSFTFSGQTECSNPGCGPSSSLLSLPSTGPPVSTGTWQPGLRDPAVPVMPS